MNRFVCEIVLAKDMKKDDVFWDGSMGWFKVAETPGSELEELRAEQIINYDGETEGSCLFTEEFYLVRRKVVECPLEFREPWALDERGLFIHIVGKEHARVLDVRGWGYLTGGGGGALGLPEPKAERIEQQLARHITDLHNKAVER
jgi:hypothetical protein